jgi:MFS family permease
MAATGDPRLAGGIAFTYPDFTVYELARFFIVVALEMQSVAVGWQVYEITKRPLDLGLVGLAQFLPGILLFLVAGHAADRFDRRRLLMLCYGGFAVCSGLLWEIALQGAHSVSQSVYPRVYPIYAVLVLLGVVRSLTGRLAGRCCRSWFRRNTFPMRWLGTPVFIKGPRFWGQRLAGSSTRFSTAPRWCT